MAKYPMPMSLFLRVQEKELRKTKAQATRKASNRQIATAVELPVAQSKTRS